MWRLFVVLFLLFCFCSLGNYTIQYAGSTKEKDALLEQLKKDHGLVIFDCDISVSSAMDNFSGIMADLKNRDATVIVLVPDHFNDINAVVKIMKTGAEAVLAKGPKLIEKLEYVIDYSAPVSIPYLARRR